jgi:hypothetical protein
VAFFVSSSSSVVSATIMYPVNYVAGYFSTTNQIKDKATPLQACLSQVSSLDSLQIIEKLCYNAIVSPQEEKFRKVKLQNPKIQTHLVKVPNALDVMVHLGWEQECSADDGDVLVLPKGVSLTMHQVRDIQNAQQALKKDLSRESSLSRSTSKSSVLTAATS